MTTTIPYEEIVEALPDFMRKEYRATLGRVTPELDVPLTALLEGMRNAQRSDDRARCIDLVHMIYWEPMTDDEFDQTVDVLYEIIENESVRDVRLGALQVLTHAEESEAVRDLIIATIESTEGSLVRSRILSYLLEQEWDDTVRTYLREVFMDQSRGNMERVAVVSMWGHMGGETETKVLLKCLTLDEPGLGFYAALALQNLGRPEGRTFAEDAAKKYKDDPEAQALLAQLFTTEDS